jgi:hypothetical protein
MKVSSPQLPAPASLVPGASVSSALAQPLSAAQSTSKTDALVFIFRIDFRSCGAIPSSSLFELLHGGWLARGGFTHNLHHNPHIDVLIMSMARGNPAKH